MSTLTKQEQINLETFSHDYAVRSLYNKEGFTPIEQTLIDEYYESGGYVLDIGCGTGRTTARLFQNHQVIGIDLSPKMIEMAKTKYPDVDFRLMNACNLDFPDGHFDYVLFSFNGIDYIVPSGKRLDCLLEIHRVLKNDGVLIYSSHNALRIPTSRVLFGIFLRNLLSFRLFSHYREEKSITGKLITYYGMPYFEKKLMKSLGFMPLKTVGRRYQTEPFVSLLELSPYYVMQKE
jgi:ubiquinone/menaquinone biosynthesis C-methylase UbiE